MPRALRTRWGKWSAFLLLVAGTFAALLTLGRQGSGHEDGDQLAQAAPVALRENPVDLHLVLGLKDEEQIFWEGEVEVKPGRVVRLDIERAARNSTIDGTKFKVRNARAPQQGQQQRQAAAAAAGAPAENKKAAGKKQADGAGKAAPKANEAPPLRLVPVRLKVVLDAPLTAELSVHTSRGDFSFVLADLPLGEPKFYLERQASIEREESATPLTGPTTEDDHPVLVKGRGGEFWLAYVAYTPGTPLVAQRVLSGEFDALVPKHNGDQILLARFDGRTLGVPQPVTGTGCDVWRPTIAMDGQGVIWIVWTQKVEDDWKLLARSFRPAADPAQPGNWSEIEQITHAPGADLSVVAATDSTGRVWLAWQAWRDGNYEIQVANRGDGGPWSEPQTISTSKANDWNPAIAADGRGRVYVSWDTYDAGNYDVELKLLGDQPRTWHLASSARFEARSNLVCDADNRLWIAYEEGDEQWGKDFASPKDYVKVGLPKNPGFGLYVNRTVRVKCLVDDLLKQPAGSLEAAFSGVLARNKSVPRMMCDRTGGLWLLVRHHPMREPGGEVWNSFALRYNGQEWSRPRRLGSSANLLDNRPALAPIGDDLLAIYSGDDRTRTQDRGQDDLYAAILTGSKPAASIALVDDLPAPPSEVPVVHPSELADIGRLRQFRLTLDGKELRLVRGEFHRHTEFSAHNDQDGLIEDALRYALDAGRLDWMGDGDHDNGFGHEYMWWLVQKTFDVHHHPPYFVGAMTYERSVVYPNGHRNVIMPRRGIRPLPRGELPGTPEDGTPDTKLLYAYLKHFGGICVSHTSGTGMGTDWRDNDPEVEPVVEIYQGHRHNYEHFGAPRSATAQTQIGGYEPAGFVWNALEKGYRLGFESSSDHISTHMSYGVLFVEDVSRQGIIDAFKSRHCYAATDNILLVVRSGGHLMGDAFRTAEKPTLAIEVFGTDPIAKLHVVRNNKYIYTAEPNEAQVRRTFTDNDAEPGKTSYYYVRVEQADGDLAWASPMWITYQP